MRRAAFQLLRGVLLDLHFLSIIIRHPKVQRNVYVSQMDVSPLVSNEDRFEDRFLDVDGESKEATRLVSGRKTRAFDGREASVGSSPGGTVSSST